MKKENIISFRVHGRKALFCDPVNRVGGEKMSYQIPTYQALKGIAESLYWKPTLYWRVLRCRVINPIQTQSEGVRPILMNGGNTLSYYTYLKDVCYEVEIKMEWNENRKDLIQDRNEDKHYWIAKRMVERGGRRDVFLGTRECQAYIEPCVFGEGKGDYDDQPGELSFGLQFHSFVYPDEASKAEDYGNLTSLFWWSKMQKGEIIFPSPDECTIRRRLHPMGMKEFKKGVNFSGYDQLIEGESPWDG